MLERLDNAEVLQVINLGMSLGEHAEHIPAEGYLLAGYCEQQISQGLAAIKRLSASDQKMLKLFVGRVFTPLERNSFMEVSADLQLFVTVHPGYQQLVTHCGEVVAIVMGEGVDADVEVKLSGEVSMQGCGLLTHVAMKEEVAHLLKQRDPFDVILSAVGNLILNKGIVR